MIQCHQTIGKNAMKLKKKKNHYYKNDKNKKIHNFNSNPSITYAPGLSIDVPKAPRGQGHPLQSFSVPGKN